MMAATAAYRDDTAGAIVTGGTSTSYTLSSFSSFNSLANMNGQEIWFTPHTTNGATVTINVDSLGAKPLRSAPSSELLAGVLIQGTPYGAVYNNTDGAWYLKGFYGNPYNIPLGAGMDFWLPTAPNSSFAFPAGQAISRTTYATLFGLMGTQYGTGDGSTTFNLPDKRGRVSAALDNLNGGTRANRLTATTITGAGGAGGLGLGDTGGAQTHTLTASEIPTITSTLSASGTGSGSASASAFQSNLVGSPGGILAVSNTGGGFPLSVTTTDTISGTATSNNTGGAAHNIVPPVILCNYIMRVL
jgi:microcystin-dependent protein